MAEPPKPPTRNLWVWSITNLGLLFWLLLQMLVVGVVIAMVKRRFSYLAFAAGLVTMVVGISVICLIAFSGPPPLRGWHELFLWGGSLVAVGLGGVVIALVGRRVGLWESYLAWLVTLALVIVHLAKGWDVILGIGPGDQEVYLEFLTAVSPGVKIFGPMWDRFIGLAALGAFLMAVFGGSIAFLFFGDEGRLNPSFDVEWTVARRHLAGRRGLVSAIAIVAVLGIALGVAALVTVTAVMSGYQNDVQAKILSTNAHLVVQKYGIDFTEYEEVARECLTVEGVLAATPFSFNEAMLSDGETGIGVLIKGIVPKTAGRVTAIDENLCETITLADGCRRYGPGAPADGLVRGLAPLDGLPTVLLGSELFYKLGRPVGEEISLTTPVGIAGARGNAPKRMDFRIRGAFRSGMHEFDSRLLYMELSAAQKLMGMGEAVNGVEFRVSDPEEVESIARDVLIAAGRYPYRTLDWRELNSGIFTALKLQKIVMFLVLCFIVIVAAFNIASTLFMAVVEKSHEIGVLKSMGARDVSIMKIFVLEGWIVGGFGTLLGVVLGLGACALLSQLDLGIAADVYMVGSLQVLVNPAEVAGTAAAALIISHLATLYPSLKAARQPPVDAMRYE